MFANIYVLQNGRQNFHFAHRVMYDEKFNITMFRIAYWIDE